MSKNRRGLLFKLLVFLIPVIVLVLVASFIYLNSGRVFVFCVNKFTDINISYDSSKGNIFNEIQIEGLRVELKEKNLSCKVSTGYASADFKKLFKNRELVLNVKLERVSFSIGSEGDMSGKTTPVSSDSLLTLPFSLGQEFNNIDFKLDYKEDILKVLDVTALSQDIRFGGEYVYSRRKNNVLVDFKISFSPVLADSFPETLRKNMLSPDEGGWYSTTINYKGNPTFLKALYVLSAV